MSDLRNEAGTPQHLFDVWRREYRFDVDICAVLHNTKLPIFLTPEYDALGMDWAGLRPWCNAPFRNIAPWLAHSHEPIFVAYLLPARTDRIWWQQYKPLAECHYIVGQTPHCRPQFVPPPGVKYSSNPMSLVLFLFGEGATPGQERWRSGRTGELL